MAINHGEEDPASVKERLKKLFGTSISHAFPDVADVEPLIVPCNRPKFGDYQCNNAMELRQKLQQKKPETEIQGPAELGQAIKKNLPESTMIESCSIAGPGFVNVALSKAWMATQIQKMLVYGIESWAPKLGVRKVLVDFSSPNMAKELHVGHVRSIVIGDMLARTLEYANVEVLRRNHVGDWGTQFGMLLQFLVEKDEDIDETNIQFLQHSYKESKQKFDGDPEFKIRALKAVVRLQGGEEEYLRCWTRICEISRTELNKIYGRLDVQLEEKGESFYKPYIPGVLLELTEKGLIEDFEGARVIFVDGRDSKPVVIVKRDGAYVYATTDLAALWYRINVEKAEWIIYVTDVSQDGHFNSIFSIARRLGWCPPDDSKYPKVSHVGFGLVHGEDGKRYRTRSTEIERLVDLLDEAKSRSKQALVERGKDKEWTVEELEKTAEAVGYGAVKYADLKNNRLTEYTFNFDHMLQDKGNTAVCVLYAHARICSIISKSGEDIEELKSTGSIVLEHADEHALALHMLRFAEVVEEICCALLPNKLCDYLYNLSEKFTAFYTSCQVVGSSQQVSRLLLCQATAVVMRKCFHLLEKGSQEAKRKRTCLENYLEKFNTPSVPK